MKKEVVLMTECGKGEERRGREGDGGSGGSGMGGIRKVDDQGLGGGGGEGPMMVVMEA